MDRPGFSSSGAASAALAGLPLGAATQIGIKTTIKEIPGATCRSALLKRDICRC